MATTTTPAMATTTTTPTVGNGRADHYTGKGEHGSEAGGEKFTIHGSLLELTPAWCACVVIAQIRANTCALNHSENEGCISRRRRISTSSMCQRRCRNWTCQKITEVIEEPGPDFVGPLLAEIQNYTVDVTAAPANPKE
jgi:hypothetical protein